ncbi:hypothetical protein [Marivita geojedonensis]|uniref:hypothetical protein n=2 Tax=Marivita geojedonensis TaxID=1123756 RepID=UPI001B8022B3|nr:hypothetical protein [Marivita geojedonensis]
MVSSNKILTVSYGTFSCTLEGFDNSFDTMKAIAEYFRDLAQDDRYFGAEPPTPDAEMLARIAEREIERRVEARFEKGNLVLRPTDESEPPRGDVAPDTSADAAKVGATVGAAATALAVADTQAEGFDTDVDLTVSEDASLADLVTEEAPVEDIAIDLSELDLSDDGEDDDTADDILFASDDEDVAESIDDLIAGHDAEPDNVVTLDTSAEEIAEHIAEAPAVTDSVADKLQRIRAVVASKAQKTPEYIEDEHAMSGPDGDGIDENDALDTTLEIPGFVEAPEAQAVEEDFEEEDTTLTFDDAEDEDDMIFSDTIADAMSDQIEADEAEVEAGVEDHAAEEAQSELEALRAKIAELEAQAAAAAQAQPIAEEDDEDDVAALTDAMDFDDEDEDDEDDIPLVLDQETRQDVAEDDEDEDEDTLDLDDDFEDEDEAPAPIVARVAKAKRADVEAALASGDIEEYDDEDEFDDEAEDDTLVVVAKAVPGLEDSSLTPEQEAELARELADLHAEIEEDEDWDFEDEDEDEALELSEEDLDAASANIRKAVKLTSPGRALLTDTSIEEDDDSVERLADKTDTEMEEPEGNRRRSAIAHLRAAVAATKADRLLGFGKKAEVEEEPYREDLADAVRPRRPKVTEARSARPAPVRPAPLKLVAEQRIDVDAAPKSVEPVRPRRVLRTAEAIDPTDATPGDDIGFAEFAESQGAHTLAELLEAAAAYMSFVEGRDQFSRPQLMTKLHQAEGEASSREERLRSFGQLLREGKIEKKGGGRFAASDSIGFKPDARAAG